MIRVPSEKHFFAFDPSVKPAVSVDLNQDVTLETLDCFSNQILSEDQLVTDIDFSRVNPATGPVFVNGVKPGDALVVNIKRIDLVDSGVIVTVSGFGVLGDLVEKAKTRVCRINGDTVDFLGMDIPMGKMIGVIGVATPEKTPCGVPGRHGGNLDSKVITEGAKLYLPVFYEGGLFGLGDLHAVMGDGEICVASCETHGEVTVSFSKVDGANIAWPFVEDKDYFYILVSKEDVFEAFKEGVKYGVKALQYSNELEWHDAYMLGSLVIDVQVSQLVNPSKTIRVRIPKKYVSLSGLLSALGSS
ncbi:MAG: acetamidase/formamidase family protein [Desulfurococcales archaeon]|nr:acetamidase/formamidase family protein [Desulfurococcales archaeon]